MQFALKKEQLALVTRANRSWSLCKESNFFSKRVKSERANSQPWEMLNFEFLYGFEEMCNEGFGEMCDKECF